MNTSARQLEPPIESHEARALRLLYEISRLLNGKLDVLDVLQPILEAMGSHLPIVRGAVTLLKRDTKEILIDVAYGMTATEQSRGRYQLGEGVTGQVVASGEPVVIPRISDTSRFLNRTGARNLVNDKDAAFLCVPIKLGSEVLGALSVDHRAEESAHLDAHLQLMTVVASMIAQAVEARRAVVELSAHDDGERPAALLGSSKAMKPIFNMIRTVAPSDATVLIRGESGVGKELVANAIHENSPRRDKPFIKVNCAALPESIIESELFGHERGAFTGAITQRIGRFELADGGTIFLDEIGDFSPATQITLLRILQEREFQRVGGTETIDTDVRVVAATNRDLEALMAEGKFRQDLYYRLNVFPIRVPELRERRTDILLLADHFVEKFSKQLGKEVRRVSTRAIDMLMAYHWPGNVRELENCIERAVIITEESVIHGHHLPPTLQTADATGTSSDGGLDATLDAIERDLIHDALKSARGNMAKAARQLKVSERIMGLRVNKYEINPKRYRIRR